ncbi:unnamed protein product [Brassica rapa]|uniref:Uncharacterized protein n=1 Tax=Brassica campestris TaxID=3711 RepID=A0A8D9CWR3_BRACM|nr:unnamed protein product [Brassica rapa]
MKFNVKQRLLLFFHTNSLDNLKASGTPPNLVCCADAISTGEKKKETSCLLGH